jgi:hypothetical protein
MTRQEFIERYILALAPNDYITERVLEVASNEYDSIQEFLGKHEPAKPDSTRMIRFSERHPEVGDFQMDNVRNQSVILVGGRKDHGGISLVNVRDAEVFRNRSDCFWCRIPERPEQ